jgi:hypothetical protein
MMLLHLAAVALAQPAVLVDCTELGSALRLFGRGGAAVEADDKGAPVAVPEGLWTFRFLSDDIGKLEVKPDTVLVASFEDQGKKHVLQLAAWPATALDDKLCKDLRKGELSPPTSVLLTWRLAAD